jgi:hypothetical protein
MAGMNLRRDHSGYSRRLISPARRRDVALRLQLGGDVPQRPLAAVEDEALPPPIFASAGTFFSTASLTLPSAGVKASAGNFGVGTNAPGASFSKSPSGH